MRKVFVGTALAAVLVSCVATIDGGVYMSKCLELILGGMTMNTDTGGWSFSGAEFSAIDKKDCPAKFDRVEFEAGVDSNNDGELQANERLIYVNDTSPGDHVVVGATTGTYGGPNGKVIVKYNVYYGGNPNPAVSKTEIITPKA